MLPAALCIPRNWEGLGGRQEVQGWPPESSHFIIMEMVYVGYARSWSDFRALGQGFLALRSTMR